MNDVERFPVGCLAVALKYIRMSAELRGGTHLGRLETGDVVIIVGVDVWQVRPAMTSLRVAHVGGVSWANFNSDVGLWLSVVADNPHGVTP
jgi:hypothetical protein